MKHLILILFLLFSLSPNTLEAQKTTSIKKTFLPENLCDYMIKSSQKDSWTFTYDIKPEIYKYKTLGDFLKKLRTMYKITARNLVVQNINDSEKVSGLILTLDFSKDEYLVLYICYDKENYVPLPASLKLSTSDPSKYTKEDISNLEKSFDLLNKSRYFNVLQTRIKKVK
jgi:hypothetical protein